MDITAVTALFSGLSQVELITWVERGWVIPDDAGSEPRIPRDRRGARPADPRPPPWHGYRRGRVPLVLSLLDQVYELRSRLKSVLHAVEAQPRDVQVAILAALDRERP